MDTNDLDSDELTAFDVLDLVRWEPALLLAWTNPTP